MATILFIEDDLGYAKGLVGFFAAAGHRLLVAGDFQTALATIEGEAVDLLLTDIRMPSGQPHGFALARMVHHRRPDLPVLYLTALTSVPASEREAALGKILHKPIEPEDLLRQIEAELAIDHGPPSP